MGTVDPVLFQPLAPSLSSLELSYLCPVEKIALSYKQEEETWALESLSSLKGTSEDLVQC